MQIHDPPTAFAAFAQHDIVDQHATKSGSRIGATHNVDHVAVSWNIIDAVADDSI